MPECDNCGSHVTPDYHRVFSVDGTVGCCPQCPDKLRRNGRATESVDDRHVHSRAQKRRFEHE